jgi:hypothetical protein
MSDRRARKIEVVVLGCGSSPTPGKQTQCPFDRALMHQHRHHGRCHRLRTFFTLGLSRAASISSMT